MSKSWDGISAIKAEMVRIWEREQEFFWDIRMVKPHNIGSGRTLDILDLRQDGTVIA